MLAQFGAARQAFRTDTTIQSAGMCALQSIGAGGAAKLVRYSWTDSPGNADSPSNGGNMRDWWQTLFTMRYLNGMQEAEPSDGRGRALAGRLLEDSGLCRTEVVPLGETGWRLG